MKASSIKLIVILLVSILIAAILPACGGSGPSPEIEVKLSFSEPPVLGKIVKVDATFTLTKDFRKNALGITAQIILPEGLEKIDGDLERTLEMVPGQTYKLDGRIRSIKTGVWMIAAAASSPGYEGPSGGEDLWVSVSESDARVSKDPPSDGTHTPYQTNPPPGYPNSSQAPATPISNETMPNFNFEQSIKGLSGTPK
jgi:hypothetical protein